MREPPAGSDAIDRFGEYTIEDRDAEQVQLLGIDADGNPVYQDEQTGTVFEGRLDEGDRVVPHWGERDVGDDSALREVIEDIEESVGWSELTDRAEGLLGSDDGDGDGDGD